MNSKIKQFAELSKSYKTILVDGQMQSVLLIDPERFAQMIVGECAEQSMSIGRYNTPSGITPDLAIAIAVGLKKHFGFVDDQD